jgi:hypothetical protein
MEENHHDDQNMVAIAATSSTPTTKDGVELLHELLAVAYHVFEEAKHINLKPPLQPSSRLFSQDGSATNTLNNSSPFGSPVPQGSPLEDLSTDLNGVGGSGSEITTPIANATTTPNPFNTTGISSSTHALHQVIPFTHDEIQDTYTKIVTLKNLYIKLSTELSESIKKSETSQESVAEDDQV